MIKIGTKVRLKIDCMANDKGTIGVCYETYNLGDGNGASIIFPNGEYDGFSEEEQTYFLEIIENTTFRYEFTNVMKLSADFNKGVFNEILGIDPVSRLYS